MKFLSLLFALIAISPAIFSQTTIKIPEHRMNVRKAANYYLRKKMNPSPRFSIQYTSLFAGLQGYTKRDSLLANKIINQLYQFNDILFYRLMRIRLEWEFKRHIVKSPLDSASLLLKNNIDSAKYYYMLGLFFQDSLAERLARRFGYVRATAGDIEVVDWRKMKTVKWRNRKVIGSTDLGHHDNRIDPMGDSVIVYYKRAIDNDPTEFHYLKEFILFMSNLPEDRDAEMKQVIASKLENYSDKEKNWVKKYFGEF
ncbi:MAG TPA: hypothetical protein VFI06_08560 [Chitinophagaceae bacterium]|nr:hypothetical protein [Chitinophagaceae bacterium]